MTGVWDPDVYVDWIWLYQLARADMCMLWFRSVKQTGDRHQDPTWFEVLA